MRHGRRAQMDQHDTERNSPRKRRRWLPRFNPVTMALLGMAALGIYQFLAHPNTPVPDAWNPTVPLRISDPITPLTRWKLARTSENINQCRAALTGFSTLEVLAPFEQTPQCHIRDRVEISQIGQSRIAPLDTRCAIALRLAMWEYHSLQPAAADLMGTPVDRILHIGSYNCRVMRTSTGPSTRMSTHATANAVDITGFVFADGTRSTLLADWDSPGPVAAFLRAARDGACQWFGLTLSPDYNRLHADHFHMQTAGWQYCS